MPAPAKCAAHCLGTACTVCLGRLPRAVAYTVHSPCSERQTPEARERKKERSRERVERRARVRRLHGQTSKKERRERVRRLHGQMGDC